MTEQPRFTIVVPMKNESGIVARLAQEIEEACAPIGPFEAIFVDDGSDDATPREIAEARARHPWLRQIRHAESRGQSCAVATGVRRARAPVVCTMDGDGQNPPAEAPKLVAPLLSGEDPLLGLVAGARVNRQDTGSRRWASRAANALRARILRDGSPDTGCGLKAFRRDDFLRLPYFDHMHRYLPSLFIREGWRVETVPVSHRAREQGVTKYTNLGRALVGALDLFGVWWLMRRRRPEQASEVE